MKTQILIIITVISAFLLALERFFVVKFSLSANDDCYFTLVLFCPLVFLLISKIRILFKLRLRIRELSVIIYVTHGCCGRIFGFALKHVLGEFYGIDILKIILSIIASFVICYLLINLREKRGLRVLKYAY